MAPLVPAAALSQWRRPGTLSGWTVTTAEPPIDLPLDSYWFSIAPIEAVQQFFGLGLPLLFHLFSLPGSVWGMPLAVGLGRWLGGRTAAAAVIAAIVLGTCVKQTMTLAFEVPRPQGPEIVVYEDIELGSFPSGHTFVATMAWGMLWALGLSPAWVPVLIAAGVSLGRLYLGVHFLADVVFGFLLAIPVLLGCRYLWQRLQPALARRSFGFWCWAGAVAVVGSVPPLLMAPGNARRWEIVGLVAGTALALLVESRWLPAPGAAAAGRRAPALAIGLTGTAALITLDRLTGQALLPLNTLMMLIVCLWTLLAVPLIFRARGWLQPAPARVLGARAR